MTVQNSLRVQKPVQPFIDVLDVTNFGKWK